MLGEILRSKKVRRWMRRPFSGLLLLSCYLFMTTFAQAAGNTTHYVDSATEHNIIRDALSKQIELHNLGFFLDQSYDFAQQPEPENPLTPLTDSKTLQDAAAAHAQTCEFKHITNPYGQNLFAGTSTFWTIKHAVNSWADEARYHNYETDECEIGQQCKHYTQIVWENTRKVGCVIQECPTIYDYNGQPIFDGESGVMIVCHYDPPGNYVSQKPYPKRNEQQTTELSLHLKVMLQGPFNTQTRQMTAASSNRSLPTNEPYSSHGHNITQPSNLQANQHSSTGDNALIDWVLVELRSSQDPSKILAARALLLQSDGDVAEPSNGSTELKWNNLSAGNYYVAIRHLNHLGVMTRQPVALSTTSTTIDFTQTSTATWGQHARLETAGKAVLWGGDANHDNRIIAAGNANDVNNVMGDVLTAPANTSTAANYILNGYKGSDLNLDSNIIAAGNNNDTNLIHGNVLLHPANVSFSNNYIIHGQLP